MSKLIQRNLPLLTLLSKAKRPTIKAILNDPNCAEVCKAICELASNLLAGNLKISSRDKANLKRHKHTLRCLAKGKSLSLRRKRGLLQKGGFLGALLKPLVSIVSGLFT